MKDLRYILMVLLLAGLFTGCSDDDENLPVIQPQATGTFVDARDNFEYHWVRYGGLDWMVENAHFKIDDESKCRFYVPYEDWEDWAPEDKTSAEFGYLYSMTGAEEAAPEGWRLPTDAEWQQLETALGMSADVAGQDGWRGNYIADLMRQKGEGTQLALQLGGYYTSYLGDYDPHYWHYKTYGYYWTSTKEERQSGDFYYYRKIAFNRSQVYRSLIEPQKYMLSVRYVREAK